MAKTKGNATGDKPRRFRITNPNASGAEGTEFQVPADATEEEIGDAAAEAFMDGVSYGWEPVDEE